MAIYKVNIIFGNRGLTKELKIRFDKAGITLKMVVVDDCCHVANLYERIFPGVKVKLDLFHACKETNLKTTT